MFIFLHMLPSGDIIKHQSTKSGKIWGFPLPDIDRNKPIETKFGM